MKYRVGHLEHPQIDDPTIDEYWDAVAVAKRSSIDDSLWGVREDHEDAELVAIAYQGEAFTKDE